MAHANAGVHKSLYLSDQSVAALPYARGERGIYVARDTELTGFPCIVNRNSKRPGKTRESFARAASGRPSINAWVIPNTSRSPRRGRVLSRSWRGFSG